MLSMRRLLIVLVLLLTGVPALAQTTSVSGTITDQNSQVWAFGTVQFVFRPSNSNPTGPYFQGGAPFNVNTTVPSSGTPLQLDGTGSFAGLVVPDNNTITPSGSTFNVTVCPAATTPCFTKSLTITGATQNISSSVVPPASILNLTVPLLGARAYTDAEVSGAQPGTLYFNVTDNRLHVCILTGFPPCTWFVLNGGAGTVTSVSGLTPLFSVTNPTTTPTFALLNAPAGTVYGNPSGSSAPPSFNSLGSFGGLVSSVTGTANQVIASPTTGAVVLSFDPSLEIVPGQLTVTAALNAHFDVLGSRNIQAGAGGFYFYFLNSTHMTDNGSDGILQLTNNATSSFTRLTLGPIAGGSFPALQPNGVNLDIEKSDGSARTGIRAANVTDDALTSGHCVQAGSGGILTTTSTACPTSGPTQTETLIITTGICTTPDGSPAWGACTFTSPNWPAAFADTGYSVGCTVINPGTFSGSGNQPVAILYVMSKSTTNLTIALQNGDANGSTATTPAEIDCTGTHP
jgi:hypothetical protein